MKNKVITRLLMLFLTIPIAIGITIPLAKDVKAATLYTWTSGTTTVTLDDVGVLTVKPTSVTGAMADYTSVSNTSWYSYKAKIKSIVIADGVTKIGNYAFGGSTTASYTDLTSLSISNSVTSIGNYAFGGCNALKSIVIPNNATSIGAYAFYYCSALTGIVIPNSVTSIGTYAFAYCTAATSLTLPTNISIITIPDYAFYYCSNLTSITIPSNVKTIGNYSFEYCSSLTNVSLPSGLTLINNYSFGYCTALTNIIIPNTVNSINNTSFYVTSKLALTVNTDNAYVIKCADFTSMNRTVTFNSTGNPSTTLFTWTSGTTTITLDSLGLLTVSPTNGVSGSMANYTSSSLPSWYGYRNMVKEIKITEGVTNVSDYAFGAISTTTYAAATKITLPSTVTSIGQWAFSGCNAVQSVILPNSLTTIGNEAFYYCSALISIAIPNSVTSLGAYAFDYCTAATSLTLPSNSSFTTIPECTFDHCSSLTSITIPNSVKTIKSYSFGYCTALTNITIPNTVNSMDRTSFSVDSSLALTVNTDNAYVIKCVDFTSMNRKVTFNSTGNPSATLLYTWTSGTTTITLDSLGLLTVSPTNGVSGTMANYTSTSFPSWYGYRNMVKEIKIAEGVTNVSDYAFGANSMTTYTAATKITLPSTVTSIGQWAFSGCNAVQSVILPNSLTTIGNGAFYYCSALMSIAIPNSVTSLGVYAFAYCMAAKSLTLPSNSSLTAISDSAFEGCSSLISITIPDSVKTIGNLSFGYCTSLVNISIPGSVTSIQSNTFNLISNLNTNIYTNNAIAKNYAWAANHRPATIYTYDQRPVSLSLKANITIPVSRVIITINYPSYAATKQYKIGADGTWKNYISPVTVNENTTVYARALDSTGAVIESDYLIITNIVQIIISISDYNLNPTNKDITVTAATNIGTLNATSHTFTHNGSFDFVATDSADNVIIKTVTITNIDKDAPTDPVISINNNKLTIVSGADGESGVKETLYQLNNGNWMSYSETVTLADGTYIINAKTVDNAGNESFLVTYTAKIFDKTAVNEATNAMDRAENSKTQADLDIAKALINALSNSLEKTDLINRAGNLQKVIDSKNAVSKATMALVKAENTYIQEDLDTAIALINALLDGPEKTDLMDRADKLQKVIEGKDAVSEATMALVKAENTYIQEDLDIAIALINALPGSPEKTDLINRANSLQIKIDDINTAKVSVDAGDASRTQMVNFTLKVLDLKDLYTMQLEIRYDPKMIELDQTNVKNLAQNDNQNGYTAVQIDSKAGLVKIIYSLKGKIPGVSGNIDLIGLPFKALQIGKTTVEVSNIKLVNSHGKNIKVVATSNKKEINILSNPLNVMLTGEKGQNDWYISPVTVEINDLDAKEIYYSIDGVKYSYTQPFTISDIGEHIFIVKTDDGNGYIKEKEQVLKIDYNSSTISVDNQTYDWQNNVKIMPTYDDQDGSGILQSWYEWTDTTEQPSQWEEYNQDELIPPAEGVWYLHVKAIDVAGNVSQTVFGPYKIDNTVPTISVDNDKRGDWGSADVSVTPVFADEGGSQLKYVGYQWSLEQSVLPQYTPYTSGCLKQSGDGAWYLHLIAEDGAGNIKTVTYGPYYIDSSSPDVEFSDVSEGVNYIDTVTPNIFISDTVSGIKNQTIVLDKQPYVSGTPVTEPGMHTITVFAKDNSGNMITKSVSFNVCVKPEAIIGMTPSTNLLDTTPITWSYENSIDHNGGNITLAEWQLDTNPITTSPDGSVAVGSHVMSLRVKDDYDIWSDWVSISFTVGNIYSIIQTDVLQLGTVDSGTVDNLFDGDTGSEVLFNASYDTSGIMFTLNKAATLKGLSISESGRDGIYNNVGMDVYKWNADTLTYDYLGKTSTPSGSDEWYDVFNFTDPGQYKMLAAYPGCQGFNEWEFYSISYNPNQAPTASISMTPSANISTMTNILWNYADSSDPDGDSIVLVEWQLDSDPVTADPNGMIAAAGSHTMKLRVQDCRGGWSEWVSMTFDVKDTDIMLPTNLIPADITPIGTLDSGTVASLFDGDLTNQVLFNASDSPSGVEFTIDRPVLLMGYQACGSDGSSIGGNEGMDVYRWNTETLTYDYLGKSATTSGPKVWYDIFNFTEPGQYKILVATPGYQGFCEWKFLQQ
ncbi:leucine-rich repeat protein [Anaerocolumna xylanovorans]|uniref:Leucine rich repeat-containing protein n=1 Tax=Anaerocolumna xylanovorans DSM 12503 TaxID=1121345 RepID=A0A1M7YHK6_9FIRM|nr:leucine-rich repeat protein [Anaerocolumna xylanovorans]SHO52049.1 Leucine rich repeat-containing protein [Anaerocolumna xylanovorans DSM 12503]